MTNEERQIISQFIARVGGAPIPGPGGGSVPAVRQQAPLPPVDREADALIAQQFQNNPEARYRITQLAFVQEHALVEAQNRIQRLEWEVQQARQEAQYAQQAAAHQPQRGGGLFGGLFGGNRQPPPPRQGGWGGPPGQQGQQGYYPPPPPQQHAPGYQPGMFQQRGSGFLGTALTTAAGVAGGILAANAISSMFSGGSSGAAGAAGAAGEAASPWTSAGAVDQGGWDAGPAAGGWDQQQDTGGSWDSGGGGGGGWDSGDNSSDTF